MFNKAFQLEIEDIVPDGPGSACYCCCCCVMNLVFLILFFPCTMTQLGQFKYGLLRNKATGYVDLETIYEPGRYWIGFWKEFIEFPSTLQTIEFSNEAPEEGVLHLNVLQSRDQDGKLVKFDMSVQYRLHKEKIGELYKLYLLSYEDIYISELRDQFMKAANLFKVQDVWLNYNTVSDLMRARCEDVLNNRLATCWGLQLWGVSLNPRYEDKLVETQVRKQAQRTQEALMSQQMVRADTRIILAEYQKNITILQAGGQADVYRMERLAQATASANIAQAQGKGVQIVQDTVCPVAARAYAADNSSYTCSGDDSMTGSETVAYQHKTLLKTTLASHMAYNAKGGEHPDMINVEAQRKIMNEGSARRLLLRESGYAKDRDAQKLLKRNDFTSNSRDAKKEHQKVLYDAVGWHPEKDEVGVGSTKELLLGASDLHLAGGVLAGSHEL